MYKHMYRKLYIEGGVGADLTYQQLEQLIKGTKTTNHSVMELDRGHIEEMKLMIEEGQIAAVFSTGDEEKRPKHTNSTAHAQKTVV